ncbi:hypothetical protein JCM5353_006121 [Sporobolomyces roseus]
MSAAGLRSSRKTAQLATQLRNLQQGANTRPLPSLIKHLSLRYEGLKGNAGARHFAKEVLPGIRFANPQVEIAVEPSKSSKGKGKEDATPTPSSWQETPGITISFTDSSLQPAFFPLPQQRSDKLVGQFWATVSDEEKLRSMSAGQPIKVEPELTEDEVKLEAAVVEGIVEEQLAEEADVPKTTV